MFFIPFVSIFLQLFFGCFFMYILFVYFLFSTAPNFWVITINTILPILVLSGISLSFLVKNPVWALLFILASFVTLGILLLNIGIEFVTFFFIIVYLGALMMLFLFVVMLFNLQHLSQTTNKQIGFLQILIVFFLAHSLNLIIIQNMETIQISPLFFLSKTSFFDFNILYFLNVYFWNSAFIFKSFYLNNSIFFIIITLILLYALIGALTVISLVEKAK